MVAIPADEPDTIPVVLTGAIAGLPLTHVPPATPSLNGVVLPWHTVGVPLTGSAASTVTTIEATQPEAAV